MSRDQAQFNSTCSCIQLSLSFSRDNLSQSFTNSSCSSQSSPHRPWWRNIQIHPCLNWDTIEIRNHLNLTTPWVGVSTYWNRLDHNLGFFSTETGKFMGLDQIEQDSKLELGFLWTEERVGLYIGSLYNPTLGYPHDYARLICFTIPAPLHTNFGRGYKKIVQKEKLCKSFF